MLRRHRRGDARRAGLPQHRRSPARSRSPGLVTRWLHGLKPRWLSSVGPRLRWRYLRRLPRPVGRRAARHAGGVGAAAAGAGGVAVGERQRLHRARRATSCSSSCCSRRCRRPGRSTLFRGYLTQAFGGAGVGAARVAGARRARPGVALRARPRLPRDAPIFFDRFAFGVVAGILVIRTGGLEAGIAMHVLNNLLAFGLALAFGDMTSTLNPPAAALVDDPGHAHPVAGLPRPGDLGRAGDGPGRGRSADRASAATAGRGPVLEGSTPARVRFGSVPQGATWWSDDRTSVELIPPLGYGVIGNTTGSGPVILGSSPSIPARSGPLRIRIWCDTPSSVEFRSAAHRGHLQAPVV